LPETENLYYKDHNLFQFDAKVIEIFQNLLDKNKNNILILDRSAIYPTSGGQEHDTATLKIEGLDIEFKIVNATKVGKVVLHILDKEIPDV
jgi:Ser-tRNA(Ala) deacylase AlaX